MFFNIFTHTKWKRNAIFFLELEEISLQNSKEYESDTTEPLFTENDVVTFKLKYLGKCFCKLFHFLPKLILCEF